MDFWQWVALSGLGLTGLGVVLGGVGIWSTRRDTTRQIGETTRLIATAEERTQRILARMDQRADERHAEVMGKLDEAQEGEGHAEG
jgi:hypothetical protein